MIFEKAEGVAGLDSHGYSIPDFSTDVTVPTRLYRLFISTLTCEQCGCSLSDERGALGVVQVGNFVAAVVAKPDEKWGETPCAFITIAPGKEHSLTQDDVTAWCRQNLAHYKIPKSVVFGPLPKTSTGKIQKYVLRERAREV